jgi:hypothetical protein
MGRILMAMWAFGIPHVNLHPTVSAVSLGWDRGRALGFDRGLDRGARDHSRRIQCRPALPAVPHVSGVLGPTAAAHRHSLRWGRKFLPTRVAESGIGRILLPAIPTVNHFRPISRFDSPSLNVVRGFRAILMMVQAIRRAQTRHRYLR